LTAYIDVDAPKSGRPQTRVTWLTKQLQDATDDVRIDCFAMHGRGASTSELLKQVRSDPKVLIADDKREIKSFRIALSTPMGTKRGIGRGGFVQSVTDLVDEFYPTVVKTLKPWAAKAPALRDESVVERESIRPSSLVSTAISSQDGPSPDMENMTVSDVTETGAASITVNLDEVPQTETDNEREGRTFSLRWPGRK
jgi:hypothetical protein